MDSTLCGVSLESKIWINSGSDFQIFKSEYFRNSKLLNGTVFVRNLHLSTSNKIVRLFLSQEQ